MSSDKKNNQGVKKQSELLKQWEAEKEDEELASIKLAGLAVTEDTYKLDTNQEIAIWFSNNRKVAIPNRQKKQLASRAVNKSKTQKLIYDSSLLDSEANSDLINYAKEHNIQLIDIHTIDSANFSATSRQLLALAPNELDHIGTGGNPASASDIIRWIPEIMGEGVYADIDLSVDPNMQPEANPIGLPVLLHMGSMILIYFINICSKQPRILSQICLIFLNLLTQLFFFLCNLFLVILSHIAAAFIGGRYKPQKSTDQSSR